MDGTFVGELYPSYFEYNMLEYRVLDDPEDKDIAPADVVETAQDIRDFVRTGKKLPKYNDEFGFDIKHALAAAKAYSGKLNLRMSSDLHSRVAAFVAATGTTINDFINNAIKNELKKVAAF